MQCYVCGTYAGAPELTRGTIKYYHCKTCHCIFCKKIPSQIIKTENDCPEKRANEGLYSVVLTRMSKALGDTPRKILDYGCGQGSLVKYLSMQGGITAFGIDKNTSLQIELLPQATMDAVCMIEVIEHLYHPLALFKKINWILKMGGIVYIESTFVDTMGDPRDNQYIDPTIGHCCIHTVQSIAHIARECGFEPQWINQNVVVLRKKQNVELFWLGLRKKLGFIRRRLKLH